MSVGDYVTVDGLAIPTVQALIDRISGECLTDIDPGIFDDAEDPLGSVIGIFASHEREAWEALAIAYNGFNPDAAEGFLLDAICAITGTFRAAATTSSFFGPRRIALNLNSGVTVNAGALFSVAGNPSIVFESTENVTAAAAGVYKVAARAQKTGPIFVAAGTLTVIQTPIVGLNSVTNPFDAVLGTNIETDAELRLRRVQELSVAASGNPAAVTAALLAYTTEDLVKPILDAITYENTADTYDSDGRPPHSIEAVIYDGDVAAVDNDTIAQIIWDNRGGGIATYGNTYGTAIDYLGLPRVVRFSRASILALQLQVQVDYNAAKAAPSNQEIATICAEAHATHSKLGQTLVRWNIHDAAIQDNASNALGTSNIQIGPVGGTLLAPFVNYPVPSRTKTTLDTADVSVTLASGTP